MDRYLRRSFRYNGLAGAAAAALLCAIYLPIYSHGPGKLQALQLLAAVLLLKLLNIIAAWRERVLVSIQRKARHPYITLDRDSCWSCGAASDGGMAGDSLCHRDRAIICPSLQPVAALSISLADAYSRGKPDKAPI